MYFVQKCCQKIFLKVVSWQIELLCELNIATAPSVPVSFKHGLTLYFINSYSANLL